MQVGGTVTFLVDTSILIDHLRGRPEANAWLASLPEGSLAISVITRAEILSGMRPHEETRTRLLLSQLLTLSVDVPIADAAAQYRQLYGKSHQLALPDALIASTAQIHNLRVVTLNNRDFPMTDVQVLRPY